MQEKELIFNNLAITPSDLYQQMGYGERTPNEAVLRELHAVIDEVAAIVRPRFCFTVLNATLKLKPSPCITVYPQPQPTRTAPSPPLEGLGKVLALSPIIARQLRGATAFAFFVCTAGIEFEQYQQRLKQEDDLLRSFLADALGSVIAERCADRMEECLQDSIDKLGWRRTNRFSPGYCGWNVSEQQALFTIFPTTQPCGVRLLDSALMVPIKSVSGIIGIGPDVRRQDYTCGFCNMKNCFKRNK